MNLDAKNRYPSPGMRRYADLLDTRFRIPGTDIRFGLDFLIGLIPGFGDVFSFILSGGLLIAMVAKGASGKALILMIINIVLDTTLGSVPLVGDVFDLFFKANKRNLDLFQDHFERGSYQGSAWPVITFILILVMVLLLVTGYVIYLMISGLYTLLIS